ncbi:ecto-NOX disulfide-thiol exchanger 1 isoform X1 [Tachysurus ichikawai]
MPAFCVVGIICEVTSKKQSVFDVVICESLYHLFDLWPAIFSSLCKADGGVNGTAEHYQHREKSNEGVTRGPLRSEKEAVLLGVISTFLHVHPFGANIEYLWSYIQRLDAKISASELERLMVRLPNMFKQEFSGVGATLEKRWKFCGFEALSSTLQRERDSC